MRADIDGTPVSPDVARQAVAWVVELSAGPPDAALEADWRRWRAANAEHERAWRQVEAIDARLQGLSSAPALAALSTSALSRRQLLAMLVATGGAATLLWQGGDKAWLHRFKADHHTAVGERRLQVLADGTQLHLNTDTVVDVAYTSQARVLHLRRGEIRVDTAPDPLSRPFSVVTAHGRVRPVGTRFLVHDQRWAVAVVVLEGAVDLQPEGADVTTRVAAGQQARFDRGGATVPEALRPGAGAWVDGVLVATDTLGAFVAELARYRPGHLGCDEAVADLRLSGVFPLDDTDAALDTLAATLPVRVRRRSRYWVRIGARPDTA